MPYWRSRLVRYSTLKEEKTSENKRGLSIIPEKVVGTLNLRDTTNQQEGTCFRI